MRRHSATTACVVGGRIETYTQLSSGFSYLCTSSGFRPSVLTTSGGHRCWTCGYLAYYNPCNEGVAWTPLSVFFSLLTSKCSKGTSAPKRKTPHNITRTSTMQEAHGTGDMQCTQSRVSVESVIKKIHEPLVMACAYERCYNLFSTETHSSGKKIFELVWGIFAVFEGLRRGGVAVSLNTVPFFFILWISFQLSASSISVLYVVLRISFPFSYDTFK